MSYKAIERGLIDWDNYEATWPFFPTEFRASAPPPPIVDIESRPGHLRARAWSRRTDYVYTWRIPPEQPVVQRLARFFDPVGHGEGACCGRSGRMTIEPSAEG